MLGDSVISQFTNYIDQQIKRSRVSSMLAWPPGGYIGQMLQTAIMYDTFEAALTSGSLSILDNLNHIRARLYAMERGTTGSGTWMYAGSPLAGSPAEHIYWYMSGAESSGSPVIADVFAQPITGSFTSGSLTSNEARLNIQAKGSLENKVAEIRLEAIGYEERSSGGLVIKDDKTITTDCEITLRGQHLLGDKIGIGTLSPAEALTLGSAKKIGWEASVGVVDTNLYRSAANVLKTVEANIRGRRKAKREVLVSVYSV